MFSGYIFDVEGTLVDSVPQSLRSVQEALEQAGFAIPYATLQLYSGLEDDQTLQIIAADLESAQRQEIVRVHAKIYETKYLDSVKAFGGVREVFETLTARGGRIALATKCKGPELKHYLSLWTSMNLSRQRSAETMSSTASPIPAAWYGAAKTGPVRISGGNGRRHTLRRRGRVRSRHSSGRSADGRRSTPSAERAPLRSRTKYPG